MIDKELMERAKRMLKVFKGACPEYQGNINMPNARVYNLDDEEDFYAFEHEAKQKFREVFSDEYVHHADEQFYKSGNKGMPPSEIMWSAFVQGYRKGMIGD